MSMTFTPLSLTTENLFLQGAWSRMFGHFIESGREKAGLSIEQAAELAGMSTEDWAGLEVGSWLPNTRRQFRSIAVALGIEWHTMTEIVLMCRQAWGIQ
ncbi:MAG: helix-turn-helix transcriptional regulator [Terracidiphilus sp.]